MTREEAIEMIASMGKYMSSGNPIWKTEPVKEATDMAIEALKGNNRSDSLVRDDAENCKESESKLDLISRSDAIDACCRGWNNAAEDCIRNIKALPSAEPPVLTCNGCRHVGTYDTDFPCSVCIRREKDYYEQER